MIKMIKQTMEKSLAAAIKRHKVGAVIMMELPEESYFEANASSIKLLTSIGFDESLCKLLQTIQNI